MAAGIISAPIKLGDASTRAGYLYSSDGTLGGFLTPGTVLLGPAQTLADFGEGLAAATTLRVVKATRAHKAYTKFTGAIADAGAGVPAPGTIDTTGLVFLELVNPSNDPQGESLFVEIVSGSATNDAAACIEIAVGASRLWGGENGPAVPTHLSLIAPTVGHAYLATGY